jgi:hypothetical protein
MENEMRYLEISTGPWSEEPLPWWCRILQKVIPENEPIVLGPIGRNYGFLVDSSDNWKDSEEDSAEAKREFEKMWQALSQQFSNLEQ